MKLVKQKAVGLMMSADVDAIRKMRNSPIRTLMKRTPLKRTPLKKKKRKKSLRKQLWPEFSLRMIII